jgi:hypothetical protein
MKLLCLGDIAITEKDMPLWDPPGDLHPGEDTKVLFNWELPIGERINPVPRSSGPRLVAHPDSWRATQKWAPGIAALANNHILDAGEEGLAKTLELLNQAGFHTVGAGRTRDEITRPLFWETAEGRVAILNWVFPETHPDWLSMPGPNCWPGLDRAREEIRELKKVTDWVMVVAHWSDELFSYPRPADRNIALELARMGVDVIVGHHPHVVRGMEIIDSCPVFYAIGNFYFSDIKDSNGGWMVRQAPRNREGIGILVRFQSRKRPECRPLSFWQKRNQALIDPLGRATRRMNRVSTPLQRFLGSKYERWYSAQRLKFEKWGYRWHFRLWELGRRGMLQYALRRFTSSGGMSHRVK